MSYIERAGLELIMVCGVIHWDAVDSFLPKRNGGALASCLAGLRFPVAQHEHMTFSTAFDVLASPETDSVSQTPIYKAIRLALMFIRNALPVQWRRFT